MKKNTNIVLLLLASMQSQANCDCNSDIKSKPCNGNSLIVTTNGNRSLTYNWQFNSGGFDVQCGQFANGDYWIAPAFGQSTVTITGLTATGSGTVSLDENPQLENNGFLDNSNTYGNYDALENVLSDLPKTYSSDVSLVAAIQKDELIHGNCGTSAIVGSCVEAYHVVTVLEQVPPNAGFSVLRPSIDEEVKELVDVNSINLEFFPKLSYIESLNENQFEEIRQRWSHSLEVFSIQSANGGIFSKGGRAFRADSWVDDYAAGTAQIFYNDLFALMSEDQSSPKHNQALYAILTYGKDLYYAIYDQHVRVRGWGSGAGQHLGKFSPAILFAALIEDPVYSNVLQQTSLTLLGQRNGPGPQELEQINVGVNGPLWGDFPDEMNASEINRYWAELFKAQCYNGALGECLPNTGKKATRDPYGMIDGPPTSPGAFYMRVTSGPIRAMAALTHVMPQVCEIVNYPLLTTYSDRIGDFGIISKPDHCAPPDPREDPLVCDAFRARDCEYYGLSHTGVATWGPVSLDNLQQCIVNNTGGNQGQNGRYSAQHGQIFPFLFKSLIVENNWDAIRNSPQACGLPDLIFRNGF